MFSLAKMLENHEIRPVAVWQVAGEIRCADRVVSLLRTHQVQEQRRRDLPALLVVWLCIAMYWQPRRSLQSIATRLLEIPSLFEPATYLWVPSRSALTRARYRLGAAVFARLFRQVCQPLVREPTRGSHRFGLHLVALDGSVETVTDTPVNARYLGRSTADRVVAGGTQALFDASIGKYHQGEARLGWRLLRSVQAGMLGLMDAGLTRFDYVCPIRAAAAEFLAPPPSTAALKPIQYLRDGTYLAWLKASDKSRLKAAG
ncbi:MAG: transposase domain-containing protein [Chloroflexi bacterium]|nr:transposase domain-containing protein [Chloroflexota bacterium]